MNTTIRPTTFAHIVYRTYQFDEMLAWYLAVLGGRVQYQNPAIAFVTYDEEHHRVALVNLGMLKEEAEEKVPRGRPGVDHVAYGYAGLRELMGKYAQLKERRILPYWSIHHGITVSLYYADPDGNQMEFQADCFPTVADANAFMHGPHFEANPIGVEFDPEVMLARLQLGEPEAGFLCRSTHKPVSPIRGSMFE